jgi:hypothetical protein
MVSSIDELNIFLDTVIEFIISILNESIQACFRIFSKYLNNYMYTKGIMIRDLIIVA